jgi:hypothetical protein
VPAWLITSSGLPVATPAGRLVVLVMTGLPHHPTALLTALTSLAVLTVTAIGCRALVHFRRRRTLRRGSTS